MRQNKNVQQPITKTMRNILTQTLTMCATACVLTFVTGCETTDNSSASTAAQPAPAVTAPPATTAPATTPPEATAPATTEAASALKAGPDGIYRVKAGSTDPFTDSAGHVWQGEVGFDGGDVVARDAGTAIANTKDGKKASAELQTKFNPRRSTLEKRQTDIQAMTEQLRRGSATMSDDAKAKMQRDIDTNTKSLQRDAQDLNDDADQEQSKIINEIGGKMMQVVDQYAIQNGFAVVLDVSNQQTPVIWASASTEITGDIVQLYDQAHPGTEPAAARPPAAAKPPAARPPAAAPPAGRKQ